MNSQNTKSPVYISRIVSVYSSITLKEFTMVFSCDLRSLNNARNCCVVITHLSAYGRILQTRIVHMFKISRSATIQALTVLLDAGYIKTVAHKKHTNIPGLVGLVGYSITPAGREVLKRLDDLLQDKFSNLKR